MNTLSSIEHKIFKIISLKNRNVKNVFLTFLDNKILLKIDLFEERSKIGEYGNVEFTINSNDYVLDESNVQINIKLKVDDKNYYNQRGSIKGVFDATYDVFMNMDIIKEILSYIKVVNNIN